MSKIICELCGTGYPDTEEFCPTCGTERPVTVEFITAGSQEAVPRQERTPTKGGRFSNANVKKRLKNKGVAPVPPPPVKKAPPRKPAEAPRNPQQSRPNKPQQSGTNKPQKEASGSNKGLVIAAILLVIAIVAMLIYIYVSFFMPRPGTEQPKDTKPANPQQTTQGTTAGTEAPDLSCKGLTLSTTSIRLDKAGNSWLLNVTTDPVDTQDPLRFESADPNVATVTPDGKITAVAAGETTVIVICGDITAQCQVICDIVEETTVPPTTEPKLILKLNREDITFSSKGEAWPLYKGEIPLNEITWSVGNPNVATIVNGTVRAVGPGTTTVYAEYQGQKVSCIIRCSF